jgi:hypothetical protein
MTVYCKDYGTIVKFVEEADKKSNFLNNTLRKFCFITELKRMLFLVLSLFINIWTVLPINLHQMASVLQASLP